MPWKISGFEEKRWYKSPWPWVAVAVGMSLVLFAAPHAKRFYQRWREDRRITRAQAAFAVADYKRTMLNLQMVLARNPRSVEATRLAASTLDAMNSPEALQYRRRLDTLAPGDTINTLALADGLLKGGDSTSAARLLEGLPEAKRNSAKYHELTARVALIAKDTASAETHWREALRLDPGNDVYRLELARVRVGSHSADIRASAMDTLAELTSKPSQRLPALRALLQNAAAFREKSRTREFADKLIAEPGAVFADYLARLSVLHVIAPNDFPAALAQLQERAASSPTDALALLGWMNANSMALIVPDWEPKLSPEVLANPAVRAALAEADARGSSWQKLSDRLEKDNWEGLEFMRFAYLSRAAERLDNENASAAAWNNAVVAAQAQPRWLEALARTVLGWSWTHKAEDVLWKLAATRSCPRWAADHLWNASLKALDTPKMYEASRLILKLDPKDPPARNNYISLALLTNQMADSPHQLAEALYRQVPTEPVIGTTYGYSLYLLGRPWEAVAVMNTFSLEQLRVPIVSAYYGTFLAAAGAPEQAAPYLQAATQASLLPEERAMLAKVAGEALPVTEISNIDRSRTDTLTLYKESRQKYLDEPQNITARSNYILLALLARQNVDSAQQLARALYKEHPQDTAAVIGYGLSLYNQEKAADAVTAMETLPADRLKQPLVAAYYGMFLSAAGQTEKAHEYLQLGAEAAMLPEERALFARIAK